MSHSKVKFIEETHRYISEQGEMISVSKFFERFKPYIDWMGKAKKKAKELTAAGIPTTQQDILAKWERKRKQSATIGTIYHTIRETELIEEGCPVFYDRACKTKQCVHDEHGKYSIPINMLENNTVYPELMIYDEEYMICGQSDKVIVMDGKINIWDYKTDEAILFHAFSNDWVKPQKLLAPLDHLDDAKGNHYAIKMSMYMYLLWRANRGRFKPGELIIEHVHLKRNPDNDNLPVLKDGLPIVEKIEKIKLPYLKKEVMAMLRTLKPLEI